MSSPSPFSPWIVAVLRPIHWFLMRFYLRVEVRHRERLPIGRPMILAPTHRSMWDSLVLSYLTGGPLRYLVNVTNFSGVQGWIMRRMGCIAVDLDHPSHLAMRQCREAIESGEPLVVFPEATIYYYPPNHVHHPITLGVAWLALGGTRTALDQMPLVVPIRLNYSDLQLKYRSRVQIVVEEPIEPSQYLGLPRKEARAALTAGLRSRLGDVANDSIRERFPAWEFLKEQRSSAPTATDESG